MACWAMNQAASAPSSPTSGSSGHPYSWIISCSRSISNMHLFHAGDIVAAEFAGINEFLSNSQIFGAHGKQFVSERGVFQTSRRPMTGSLMPLFPVSTRPAKRRRNCSAPVMVRLKSYQ